MVLGNCNYEELFIVFFCFRLPLQTFLFPDISFVRFCYCYIYDIYCITLFFRRILISRFPYVKNSLHFNFADFPVNFIKQFVSCFFWCLKLMLLLKFVPYYCLHYIIPRILHIISRKSWYSMQTKSWWWAIPKICVYLISRFYSKREYRENLMLAKYTCFTVCCWWLFTMLMTESNI